MRCRHCNIALAPSRSFVDGEFCCDDHRQRFEAGEPGIAPSILEKLRMIFQRRVAAETSEIAEPAVVEAGIVESEVAQELEAAQEEVPLEAEQYEEPVLEEEPVYAEAVEDQASAYEPSQEAQPQGARETAASWHWLAAAWKAAPRDLKLVSVLLPVLLVIAISGSLPKVPIQQLAPQNLDQVQSQVQKVVALQWKNVNQTISDRAAVAFADDFRSGLDAWESRSNLTRSWSYDAAGFVRPGPLAIFKPSVDLSDYRFEFLGQIDQKAMGWAFRAQDLNNYYAMKFVVVKPGPLPLIHIVRYAVINGKEGPHVDKPLPLTVRTDMLYRIQVNVRGGDFTTMAQGQVVDFWSDNRLPHGGVGFFCNRGERARLSWVEVSHQYDALGRLCAYLAPYGIEGRNGNIN
ncbi:MAG TPA: hypothetical protein VK708_20545 [Bryobacteraceae bacterium]|nr:hypothetical protein [Bryobacteraceae bacterium]